MCKFLSLREFSEIFKHKHAILLWIFTNAGTVSNSEIAGLLHCTVCRLNIQRYFCRHPSPRSTISTSSSNDVLPKRPNRVAQTSVAQISRRNVRAPFVHTDIQQIVFSR